MISQLKRCDRSIKVVLADKYKEQLLSIYHHSEKGINTNGIIAVAFVSLAKGMCNYTSVYK